MNGVRLAPGYYGATSSTGITALDDYLTGGGRLHVRSRSDLVGDIVDVKNEAQWNFASNLMTRLDDLMPYGISPGNHDLAGEDSRDFNRYFPRERYLGKAWYAGGFDGCPGLKPGSVVSCAQGPAIAARETRKGIAGNTVHLTLQDYPRKADSDDWLRLYRFHGDMRAIDVITYSPRQNLVCEKAGHRKRRDCHVFTLPLDP